MLIKNNTRQQDKQTKIHNSKDHNTYYMINNRKKNDYINFLLSIYRDTKYQFCTIKYF